jgi:Trk K+ transport system NAD-binding subunit
MAADRPRRAFGLVLAFTGVVIAVGTVVFRFSLGLTWLDSIYFVVTTITTVGYGDVNLLAAPPAVKLFGILLMISGAASVAATFGLVADAIVDARLQTMMGRRNKPMRDHIVLCGLGKVGIRTLRLLRETGRAVIVVEREPDGRFIDDARALGVRVIHGDMRATSILDQASIRDAACVVAVSSDDLANLEAVLQAKAVNPAIRVVLRLFDPNLAEKVESTMGLGSVFSTSHLAAPAFAMAAVDPGIVGSFYVGSELVYTVHAQVGDGCSLVGRTIADVADDVGLSVLAMTRGGAPPTLHPSPSGVLFAGDRLTVALTADRLPKLRSLTHVPNRS